MARTKTAVTPSENVAHLNSQNAGTTVHCAGMQLEAYMWDALQNVALREGISVDDLLTRLQARAVAVHGNRNDLTSAVRTFLAFYYRRAATEEGHSRAGHGIGDPFLGTPFEAGECPLSYSEMSCAHS